MLLGWFIYAVVLLFMVFVIGLNITQLSGANETMLGFDNNEMVPSNDVTLEYLSPILPFLFVFALVYLTFWIVQAADANRLAKKFNRQLEKEGTLLWS